MRIGLLIENAAPFVSEEVTALRRLGVEVSVASVFRPAPAEDWERRYEGPILYPRPGRPRIVAAALRDAAGAPRALARLLAVARAEGAPPRLVALAAALARRARREGWQHLHGSFATFPAWTAWAVARLAGLPFSFTAHAYDVQCPRPWLPRLLREARFVRAISAETAARLRGLAADAAGAQAVRVGHLGVDVERFRPATREAADPPAILCVAALGPTKGHAPLLEACARLGERPWRLELVGEGPLRDALERRARALGIAARVRFAGAGSREQVVRALGDAAVFALPCEIVDGDRHDGLPVALLEAMAAGLPVVSTPVGGICDAIRDGGDGRLVPAGDVAALAATLAELLARADLRARLGAAARATVLARFRLEDAASRLACWMGADRLPAAAAPHALVASRGAP